MLACLYWRVKVNVLLFDTYKFTKTVDKTLFWQPKPIYYLK